MLTRGLKYVQPLLLQAYQDDSPGAPRKFITGFLGPGAMPSYQQRQRPWEVEKVQDEVSAGANPALRSP